MLRARLSRGVKFCMDQALTLRPIFLYAGSHSSSAEVSVGNSKGVQLYHLRSEHRKALTGVS